jgi:hypothetical protein
VHLVAAGSMCLGRFGANGATWLDWLGHAHLISTLSIGSI